MEFYSFHKPVVYIEVGGKYYDSRLYIEAVREADCDPELRCEIEQLEEKYILKHLKLLEEDYKGE